MDVGETMGVTVMELSLFEQLFAGPSGFLRFIGLVILGVIALGSFFLKRLDVGVHIRVSVWIVGSLFSTLYAIVGATTKVQPPDSAESGTIFLIFVATLCACFAFRTWIRSRPKRYARVRFP
jgi:hypothetical protein